MFCSSMILAALRFGCVFLQQIIIPVAAEAVIVFSINVSLPKLYYNSGFRFDILVVIFYFHSPL